VVKCGDLEARENEEDEIDTHKVFEARTKVGVLVEYDGDDWTDNSTISFTWSVDNGAQLYFGKADDDNQGVFVTAGYPYTLQDIESILDDDTLTISAVENVPLYLFAPNPSGEWDDIDVRATAIINPNGSVPSAGSTSNSGYHFAHDCGTAYHIGMEVQERPWGGDWNAPEDSGTYVADGRTWYHLWKINDNAIRAVPTPMCLAEAMTKTTFTGLDVRDFEPEERPFPGEEPPIEEEGSESEEEEQEEEPKEPRWKMIDSGIEFYPFVAPTMHLMTVSGVATPFTGTIETVDLTINDIKEVEWKICDNWIQDNGRNLAKLISQNGSYCVFPEKRSPISGHPIFYCVEIRVELKKELISNQEASINFGWFDPNHPIGSKKRENQNRDVAERCHGLSWDNYGAISLSSAPQLRFTSASNKVEIIRYNVTSAYAGDNYIVAVHPNTGVVPRYRFMSNSTTLTRPEGSSRVVLANWLRTATLTVWRTLWLELKQMKEPTEGIGNNYVFDKNKEVPSSNMPLSSAVNGRWMNHSDKENAKPAGEPNNFDVRFQPPIPVVSQKMRTQFERACINIEEVSEAEFQEWYPAVAWQQEVAFKKNLNPGMPGTGIGGPSNDTVGRQISTNANVNTFWILHALGAYNPDTSRDYDNTNDYEVGYATPTSALIFNETIRDLISTDSLLRPIGASWVSIPEAREIVMFHEALHYFLGSHSHNQNIHNIPEEDREEADRGIMNKYLTNPKCYLYKSGTSELDIKQIWKIQMTPKPTR